MAAYETIDPSTGEAIEAHPVMTRTDAEAALERAHRGFQRWRRVPLEERAAVVARLPGLLREQAEELGALASLEMGKPPAAGVGEVQLVAAIADWEAEHAARRLAGEEHTLQGGRAIVTHEPIGVVLGIQPWNYPYYQAARFSVPALLAGNTALLKHAPNVWGCAKRLVGLFHEAGVPEDAMVGLYTDVETTQTLLADPRVRGVNFTGSDAAGAAVAATAGRHRKKSVLELGSNDAYVVLSDADVELAAAVCTARRLMNAGQACIAAKRFIVTEPVYDEFRDAMVAAMTAATMGDPRQEDTTFGPLAREDLRTRLHEQVRVSVERGASVALGGVVPDGPGWYYPATVLEDVAPGQPAYDDELFGPVAALIRVGDDEEAMRVANDSRFGLGGGIFSSDEERALRLAREEFDTGRVNINGYGGLPPQVPFGGVKDSGYGREHGDHGILEFVNTKTIMVPG